MLNLIRTMRLCDDSLACCVLNLKNHAWRDDGAVRGSSRKGLLPLVLWTMAVFIETSISCRGRCRCISKLSLNSSSADGGVEETP